MKEKFVNLTEMIFSCGMALLLLICFAAALVYTAALVIAQPFSVSIHNAVSEYMLPAVYRAGILLSFDGLINLYLRGERLFCLDVPKRKK